MLEEQTYNIIVGDGEPITVVGRAESVAKAKECSKDNPNLTVSLERADSMVTMQFREGSLEVFVTETREKNKPSRPRRDRNEDSELKMTEEATSEDKEGTPSVMAESDAPVETSESDNRMITD